MEISTKRLSIRSWSEADRPREKLILKGRRHLSDAELLAILLGSGSRSESALDLSIRILNHFNNDLNALAKCNLLDLQKFNGVGKAKAVGVTAALEFGRRRQNSEIEELPQIRSSGDAWNVIEAFFSDLHHEEFWVILLNRANKVVKSVCISSGGVAGTIVDAKIVFKHAIDHLATSVILAHNHPSGNLKPSQADLKITKKLIEAGELLDISVLDHLIIGDKHFLSFADEGLM